MLEVAIGLCLAAAVSIVVQRWLRAHRERAARLRFYRNQFFDRAEHIVKAQTIDEAKLARLRMMALDIDKPQQFQQLKHRVTEFQNELEREGHDPGDTLDDREWGALVFDYSGHRNADVIDRRIHAIRLQPA